MRLGNKVAHHGVGYVAPAAAAEDTVVACAGYLKMLLLSLGHAAAQAVGRLGLAAAANVV